MGHSPTADAPGHVPSVGEFASRAFVVVTLAVATLICVWQCTSVHWDADLAARNPLSGW